MGQIEFTLLVFLLRCKNFVAPWDGPFCARLFSGITGSNFFLLNLIIPLFRDGDLFLLKFTISHHGFFMSQNDPCPRSRVYVGF